MYDITTSGFNSSFGTGSFTAMKFGKLGVAQVTANSLAYDMNRSNALATAPLGFRPSTKLSSIYYMVRFGSSGPWSYGGPGFTLDTEGLLQQDVSSAVDVNSFIYAMFVYPLA